jgi:hypothetical protein
MKAQKTPLKEDFSTVKAAEINFQKKKNPSITS